MEVIELLDRAAELLFNKTRLWMLQLHFEGSFFFLSLSCSEVLVLSGGLSLELLVAGFFAAHAFIPAKLLYTGLFYQWNDSSAQREEAQHCVIVLFPSMTGLPATLHLSTVARLRRMPGVCGSRDLRQHNTFRSVFSGVGVYSWEQGRSSSLGSPLDEFVPRRQICVHTSEHCEKTNTSGPIRFQERTRPDIRG